MISVERRILNRRLEFADADKVLTFLEREDNLWQWTNGGDIPQQTKFAIDNYRREERRSAQRYRRDLCAGLSTGTIVPGRMGSC
jgi:hypothetical protein